MKKRILSLLLILALVPALSLPVLADSYNDVLGDAWYAGAVSYVRSPGHRWSRSSMPWRENRKPVEVPSRMFPKTPGTEMP